MFEFYAYILINLNIVTFHIVKLILNKLTL